MLNQICIGLSSRGNCSLISKPGKQVFPTHYSFYSSTCPCVQNWIPESDKDSMASLWLSKMKRRLGLIHDRKQYLSFFLYICYISH